MTKDSFIASLFSAYYWLHRPGWFKCSGRMVFTKFFNEGRQLSISAPQLGFSAKECKLHNRLTGSLQFSLDASLLQYLIIQKPKRKKKLLLALVIIIDKAWHMTESSDLPNKNNIRYKLILAKKLSTYLSIYISLYLSSLTSLPILWDSSVTDTFWNRSHTSTTNAQCVKAK